MPAAVETVGGAVVGTASRAGTIEQKTKLRYLDGWSQGTLEGLRSSRMKLG